jgi:hypothetical protein
MPFVVEGYIDGFRLESRIKTAKQAFEEAIDWHVAKQFSGVSIKDGGRVYTIPEFSEVMALQEIAETI